MSSLRPRLPERTGQADLGFGERLLQPERREPVLLTVRGPRSRASLAAQLLRIACYLISDV